jgi:hypothetical protein
MSKEPEQIEIKIEDDQPEKKPDDIEVIKAEEVVEPQKTEKNEVDSAIAELRQQLEAEKQARLKAEKEAHAMAQREVAAKNEVQDTNLQLISNAIDTVKQNNSILESQLAEAMAINDHRTAAQIQTAISTNAAKLLQLEQGKTALESQPKSVAPERPAISDPVEALASQLSPRSADWIRRNPQFARENSKFQKMIAAHQLAMADGIAPDSDEYFEAIEQTLKIRPQAEAKQAEDPTDVAAKVTQKRTAPPVAPVSRGDSSGRNNVVKLTSEEREMARNMGMTDQEYGKHKLALQREGRLN